MPAEDHLNPARPVPVVLIPTRNRAALALRAVESVLADCLAVSIVVSDNSTDSEESDSLVKALSSSYFHGCQYWRAPTPLSMGAHWDWAVEKCLASDRYSHLSVLTDRMVFRPGGLANVLAVVRRFPRLAVSYGIDEVADAGVLAVPRQAAWSNRTFFVRSSFLLHEAARREFAWLPTPRLLNSVVPVPALARIRDRFGDFCRSQSPDVAFAFRYLALEPGVVYYDARPLAQYAQFRSNGLSMVRGQATKDYADFAASADARGLNFAAPEPRLSTNVNAVMHEYCLVREAQLQADLPPIDISQYWRANARQVSGMVDGHARRAGMAVLAEHGVSDHTTPSARTLERGTPATPEVGGLSPKSLGLARPLRRMGVSFRWRITAPWTRPFWRLLWKTLSVRPPIDYPFRFRTSLDALGFLIQFPRPAGADRSHLGDLLDGAVEVRDASDVTSALLGDSSTG